jgi:hypothetical protein
MEKFLNRRKNLGEGGGKEEQIPRVIFRCQLEFKFRGENF